jgi:hypothetical protein
MKKKVDFESAKKQYKSVKYFPFDIQPGDPFVLTSDPWHYLKAFLRIEIDSVKRGPGLRDRLKKALYFAELAENFQKSADLTSLPTKGTLTYYSVLNLVKAFLLVQGKELETTIEYHGLSLPSEKEVELKIGPNSGGAGINIFQEFAAELGTPVAAGSYISLSEMISEIPEIHEMCFNLGKLNCNKRKFLPVEICILTNKQRRNKLTYEIVFEKKNSHLMRTDKFDSGILKTHLQKVDDSIIKPDCDVYQSKTMLNFTSTSDISWNNNYKKLCGEIESIHVVTMLTRQGYRYYLNLQPQKYRSPVYFFALMYYVGSVARYRPTLNAKILQGEYSAILNEAISTCPKQFLYYMVSKITKKVCAVPMAKLD